MAGIRAALRANTEDVLDKIDAFFDTAAQIAGPRAINKLGDQAQVAGFRAISQIYGVPVRSLDKYASVKRATGADVVFVLTVKGAGFPIAVLSPTQTRAGVTFRAKNGRRVLIPHAFLVRLKNGHLGVYARGAYGGKGAALVTTGQSFGRFVFGRKRLPINELFSASPPDALRNPDVQDAMSARVAEQASKVFAQELRFAASSGGSR